MANSAVLQDSFKLCHSAAELSRRQAEAHPQCLTVPRISLLDKGIPRGAIHEFVGHSSGRTACLLHSIAQAVRGGEVCAWIDTYDRFHPPSAAAAGVELTELIWVRCHGNAKNAIRATDMLLHAGGFGLVVLDLCDVPPRVLNGVPLSYWWRFRRAIENTPTILLVAAQTAQTKSCATHVLQFTRKKTRWIGRSQFRLFRGAEITAHLTKPPGRISQDLLVRTVA
jgi:hypothetical protein